MAKEVTENLLIQIKLTENFIKDKYLNHKLFYLKRSSENTISIQKISDFFRVDNMNPVPLTEDEQALKKVEIFENEQY